jgi:hypothetical protein
VFYVATLAFVLATDKAAVRFQLRVQSIAQSVTHFLRSRINNHHYVITQSELACTISVMGVFYFMQVLCLLKQDHSQILQWHEVP